MSCWKAWPLMVEPNSAMGGSVSAEGSTTVSAIFVRAPLGESVRCGGAGTVIGASLESSDAAMRNAPVA